MTRESTRAAAAAAASSSMPSGARLSFQGKLYAKGMQTDRLMRNLKSVQKELAAFEQDAVELDSLREISKELITPSISMHKDKGVRIVAACCLADVLRLFAPDAPFTAHELRDIFQFFIHLLTSGSGKDKSGGIGLASPQGPHYAEFYYLLDSLSSVKSICLVCELQGAEEMMYDLFKGFMDIVSPTITQTVEIKMIDVLALLIDEAQQLPDAVLELLMANFSAKVAKSNPAAHQLTIEVCKTTEERLHKDVGKHFRDAISTALDEENIEERNKELVNVHALIIQINRSVPGLLSTVIPLLQEDLTQDDKSLRMLSTATLGQVFGEKPSKLSGVGEADMKNRHPAKWKAWLGRAADKEPAVRAKFVDCLKNILTYHPALVPDIGPVLVEKVDDIDASVRTAVARLVGSLDYETALHSLPKEVLLALGERCRDKKPAMRSEAQHALGRLFDMAYNEIERHDAAATQQFFWIPTAILQALKSPDNSALAFSALLERYILPYPSDPEQDEAAWTARLLLVLKVGDSFAKTALIRLSNLTQTNRTTVVAFIDRCERYNGGIIDHDEDKVRAEFKKVLKVTARALGEQPGMDHVAGNLAAFAKLNDQTLYQPIKKSMDPKQDLKTLLKCRADIIKRLSASCPPGVVETMAAFWRICSFPFINRSTIGPLLQGLQQGRARYTASQLNIDSQLQLGAGGTADVSDYDAFVQNAHLVLKQISKSFPTMFTPHLPELIKCLSASEGEAIQPALRAIAAVACAEPMRNLGLLRESKVVQRIAEFVRKGQPLEAKFAAKTLAVLSDNKTRTKRPPLPAQSQASLADGDSEASSIQSDAFAARTAVETLLEEIARKLGKASGKRAVAYMHAAAQIVKHSPDMFEDKAQAIIKEVLTRVRQPWPNAKQEPGAPSPADNEKDWVEDDEVTPDLDLRLLALDLMTHRARAYAETEHCETTARPTLRFIWTVLQAGEAADLGTPAWARSRLRLRAAVSVLKLARHAKLEELITTTDFSTLAFVVQDECFGVRNGFLQRLAVYLNVRKLTSVRYFSIPFLVAFDPEEENQRLVRNFVHNMVTSLPPAQRLEKFEHIFARFVHLLAHHPDFNRSQPDDVLQFSQYIDFYLTALSTAENISMFYYIAGRLKSVRDSASVGASENLYTLSELAQLTIKRRATAQGWTLETWPGRLPMPDGIFKPLPSKEVAREVYERQFLPKEVTEKLNEAIEQLANKKRPAVKSNAEKVAAKLAAKRKRTSPKKDKAAKGKAAKAKRSGKKARKGSDDEDDEMSDAQDDDEEEDEESELSEPDDEEAAEEEKENAPPAAKVAKRTTKSSAVAAAA